MKCNSVYVKNETKGATHVTTSSEKKKKRKLLLGMVQSSGYTNLPLKGGTRQKPAGK